MAPNGAQNNLKSFLFGRHIFMEVFLASLGEFRQKSFAPRKMCLFFNGESRIIFLPEGSSICQYPCKISAINIKKQSRARLLLTHPVLYILKIRKRYGAFWKPPFQNQPKSVRLYAMYDNLHYRRKWFRQCNLSCLNLTPHTIAYFQILYLQFTYPKIANLIQILYIVCKALGCFKGGSCEKFAIDVIQISTTRRTGFNWCETLRLILLWGPFSHCCEEKNGHRQSICENRIITLWNYCH